MTAVSLSSVREVVRFRGDYPRSSKFSDKHVNAEIQKAWSELHELIEDQNEGYWDRANTVQTVAAQSFVSPPSDCWRIKGVDLLDGGRYRELRQVGIGDRNRFGPHEGKPEAFNLSEHGVDLYPTPNAVYTLRITYARLCVPLDESAAVDVPNDWDDYVVWATLLRLHGTEERPLGDTSAMLESAKQRIIRGASKRKQQEPEYLQLREHVPDWWL
ncbi:MAG: phage adaptor protein [Kofleriaceae bacterium]